jgi:hypothetical protein
VAERMKLEGVVSKRRGAACAVRLPWYELFHEAKSVRVLRGKTTQFRTHLV